jgi:hypothetical protein
MVGLSTRVRGRRIHRGLAKGVEWLQVASLAFPYASLVRCPSAGGHGRARASVARYRLSARCVFGLARRDAHHPGAGVPPPSGRRPRAQSPSRRIGTPRAPARTQRRRQGCPLLPVHTRAGVRFRRTLRGPYSRLSPDPIPGYVGRANRNALTQRTATPCFSGERPSIQAFALCSTQASDPIPSHHRVAVEARLRPGGDHRRPTEGGRLRSRRSR